MSVNGHLKQPARRKWLRVGAALGIAAPTFAACTSVRPVHRIAPPRGFVAPPSVLSGESWRYALINRYNGEKITEVTATVKRVSPELHIELVDSSGRALSPELYDSAWHIRQEPIYNETLVFDKPLPLLPTQLAVGSELTVHTNYRLPGSENPHPWTVTVSAGEWERLTVPAGTYDTLRIDRNISFESTDLFRRASSRVDTLWYAPAVNRWVRREWIGHYVEDGPDPFGFFDRTGPFGHGHDRRREFSSLMGFGPQFTEETEDSISWVMLEHLPAPVS